MSESQLFDALALELVEIIARHISPLESIPRPFTRLTRSTEYKESAIGAAHWIQLSRALYKTTPVFKQTLAMAKRAHYESAACCRVLDCHEKASPDWPLEVLRLRGDDVSSVCETTLSHVLPIARQTLRLAYWNVAREVHPDRLLEGDLATSAMAVLNEAFRIAQLHFGEVAPLEERVIRLDALGLEHH